METTLARLTLVGLVVYFPLETWVSAQGAPLWHPDYVVDLIAMGLLLWGSLHSLRARPACSPGLLCAGYAWTAANGWRAVTARLYVVEHYGAQPSGWSNPWAIAPLAIVALGILCVLLGMVAGQQTDSPD